MRPHALLSLNNDYCKGLTLYGSGHCFLTYLFILFIFLLIFFFFTVVQVAIF